MAVHVHLKAFDGPMDLLLHLIGKAKVSIKDIFVSQITEQYVAIVQNAPDFNMDEASEFIAMAALLIEIKSRHLLPKPPKEEEDPEQLLINRLIAYQQYKQSAVEMAQLEDSAKKVFGKLPEEYPLPPQSFEIEGLTLSALWEALQRVQNRTPREEVEEPFRLQDIRRDIFTVEECMEAIESRLSVGHLRFEGLLTVAPSKEEIVTLFIALLELLKLGKAHVVQTSHFDNMTIVPGRRTLVHEDS